LQETDSDPAIKVQITEASIPILEDHIEGMEYESHYGDMRTEIQEVRLNAQAADTAVHLSGRQSTVLPESFCTGLTACITHDLLRLSRFISNASCYAVNIVAELSIDSATISRKVVKLLNEDPYRGHSGYAGRCIGLQTHIQGAGYHIYCLHLGSANEEAMTDTCVLWCRL